MPGSCADAVPAATPQRAHSGKSFFLLAAQTNAAAKASPAPSAEGREILRRLISKADILMHNFRPGVPDRLGFDYDDVPFEAH